MVRYFNTLPLVTNKINSQKIGKDIEELNDMLRIFI